MKILENQKKLYLETIDDNPIFLFWAHRDRAQLFLPAFWKEANMVPHSKHTLLQSIIRNLDFRRTDGHSYTLN